MSDKTDQFATHALRGLKREGTAATTGAELVDATGSSTTALTFASAASASTALRRFFRFGSASAGVSAPDASFALSGAGEAEAEALSRASRLAKSLPSVARAFAARASAVPSVMAVTNLRPLLPKVEKMDEADALDAPSPSVSVCPAAGTRVRRLLVDSTGLSYFCSVVDPGVHPLRPISAPNRQRPV